MEQSLYLFFIASLLLNLTPGNDMLFVASRTLSQGTKAGIVSALGVCLGCIVHIAAAILGLSIIIAESAFLFDLIKYIGAGYLIYLGIKAFMTRSSINEIENSKPVNTRNLFKQGLITNALNPKVAIFFLSFLPQFIDPASQYFRIELLGLGLWFAIQGTLILMILAVLLGKTRDLLKGNRSFWNIQQKVTGAILIGLGIKIALTERY